MVGDSTLILAAPKLGALGLEADARGCRQFTAGVALLRQRRDAGTLPRVVVLALGANGPISDSAMGAALKAVGRNRVLALVTARRSPASDRQMYAAAHRHRNRVLLIDWVAHQRAAPELVCRRRPARRGRWCPCVRPLHPPPAATVPRPASARAARCAPPRRCRVTLPRDPRRRRRGRRLRRARCDLVRARAAPRAPADHAPDRRLELLRLAPHTRRAVVARVRPARRPHGRRGDDGRAPMRRRTALLLLGAAVLLAACGSSPSAPSAATTTGGVSRRRRTPAAAQTRPAHRHHAALGTFAARPRRRRPALRDARRLRPRRPAADAVHTGQLFAIVMPASGGQQRPRSLDHAVARRRPDRCAAAQHHRRLHRPRLRPGRRRRCT